MGEKARGGRAAQRLSQQPLRTGRAEELLGLLVSALKGTLKVLVVDDDDDLLALFTAHLQLCSLFDVQAAGTVEHARELAGRRPWHCWLVDLYVPRLDDGMALIRDFASTVPIVVLSGRSTGGDGYQAGQQGIVSFLDKGAIDAETLVRQAYRVALRRLLCSRHPCAGGEDQAVTVLFEQSPQTVAQWARALAVTARALEQRIEAISTMRPGTLLALHGLYALAFRSSMAGGREPVSLSRSETVLLRRYHRRTLLMDALQLRHGSVRAS